MSKLILFNLVSLSSGIPMFKGSDRPLNLKLSSSRVFRNGNLLLVYRPEEGKT